MNKNQDKKLDQAAEQKVELKHIAKKQDVWHLVTKGILMQQHYDFEAFDLNLNFTQIASYGDAIGDIAGNLVSSEEYHVKRPDRYLPTIESLLVTKTQPDALDEDGRLAHPVAMGV